MKTIQILRSQAELTAGSIGNYIFKQLRSDGSKGMPWLLDVCSFYQNIRDAVYEPADKGYLTVPVSQIIIDDVPALISEYLPKEINELIEDDMDWLCEMVSIYRQLQCLQNTKDGDDTAQMIKQGESISIQKQNEKPIEQIPEKESIAEEHIQSRFDLEYEQSRKKPVHEPEKEMTNDDYPEMYNDQEEEELY